MKKAKPLPEGTYKDEDKIIRIDAGHPDLGKYKIEVSQVIDHERAIRMSQGLNAMPSNRDPEMFSVFGAKTSTKVRDEKRKPISVPGFIIKRKVLINDRLEFLE